MTFRSRVALAALAMLASCDGPADPRVPNFIEIQTSGDTITLNTLTASDSVLLTAVVRDQGGRPFSGDSVSWLSSSNSIVLTRVDARSAKASWSGSSSVETQSVEISALMFSRNGQPLLRGTTTLTACGLSSISPTISSKMLVGKSAELLASTPVPFTELRQPVPAPTWSSSNPAVVAINGSTATAMQTGAATLNAAACGQTSSVDVLVIPSGYVVTPVTIPGDTTLRLNSKGQVVSLSKTSQSFTTWDRGTVTVTDLGSCWPIDINDSGQVLCDANGPVIWENGVATQRDTVTFSPRTISNDGRVLGVQGLFMLWGGPGNISERVQCDLGAFECYALSDFNGLQATFEGHPAAAHVGPAGWVWNAADNRRVSLCFRCSVLLNDSGDVVHPSDNASPRYSMLRLASELWSTARQLPIVNASAMNNKRSIVGLRPVPDRPSERSVYENGAVSFLNRLLADPSWSITKVWAINDKGQMLGRAVNSTTNVTSTVLIDPPTP